MPAAVAPPLHHSTSFPRMSQDMDISPKSTYPTLAAPPSSHSQPPPSLPPPTTSSSTPRNRPSSGPKEMNHAVESGPSPPFQAQAQRTSPKDRTSPLSNSTSAKVVPPKIIVKKEPISPPSQETGQTQSAASAQALPSSNSISSISTSTSTRHRPTRLNLTSSRPPGGPQTARDASTLGPSSSVMQDVGMACLSPGFATHDPGMREQLQRSISVRDQQRHIIESRLQKSNTSNPSNNKEAVLPESSLKTSTPSTSKKRPPPGLQIFAPSNEQFARERVIQSAPLNQTFTGRDAPNPYARHAEAPHHDTGIRHVQATQTTNRLPPIGDVFGTDSFRRERERDAREPIKPTLQHSHSYTSVPRPLPSPGFPPQTQGQTSDLHPAREHSHGTREHRSAEEHIESMTGGRADLKPKIVHYNSHNSHSSQPGHPQSTTPPNGNNHADEYVTLVNASGEGRRVRRRTDYEYGYANGEISPPLATAPVHALRPGEFPHTHQASQAHSHAHHGQAQQNHNAYAQHSQQQAHAQQQAQQGPFGYGRDSPETVRRKKAEFMGLCARAWDLFHS